MTSRNEQSDRDRASRDHDHPTASDVAHRPEDALTEPSFYRASSSGLTSLCVDRVEPEEDARPQGSRGRLAFEPLEDGPNPMLLPNCAAAAIA
jgi:hypothetical protein